ncbi:MAG: hypothetical protein U9N11_06820 [Campylobacterota bacterium]|nr:hypothetical protein [Campylobacterota bacterium]
MNKFILSVVVLLLMNNCGGSSTVDEKKKPSPEPSTSSTPSFSPEPSPSAEPEIITHNGTRYGMVTSPYTEKIWLDRNLGAARVCLSFDDVACYGDYYQWGRGFDGHQDFMSSTTNEQASDINNAGSNFILDRELYRNDWANESDKDGDKRIELISSYDGSFVCPKGFRIPSADEFLAETSQAPISISNNIEAYESFLKLPSSGLRLGDSGKLRIDDRGFYKVRGGNYEYSVDYFYYSEDDIGKGSLSARVNGSTIRCIKF